MAKVHQLVSADGFERVVLIPCTCGDCDGTSLIVEQRVSRKKRRRLELTLNVASLEMLQSMIEEAKAYHLSKDDDWPCVEAN